MCVSAESLVLSDSLQPQGLQPTRLLCPWDSPGKSTGVGCHALLQYKIQCQKYKLIRSKWPSSGKRCEQPHSLRQVAPNSCAPRGVPRPCGRPPPPPPAPSMGLRLHAGAHPAQGPGGVRPAALMWVGSQAGAEVKNLSTSCKQ